MMRYDVTLRLSYVYDHPAASGRHVLRLMPLSAMGSQRLVAGRLALTPEPDEQRIGQDFFGNQTLTVAYRRPHETLDIALHARVQREMPFPSLMLPPTRDALLAELARHRDLGAASPLHMLAPSPRVATVAPFRAFAEAAINPGMSVHEVIRAVGRAVHAHMTFDPEATEVETSGPDAFAQARGVCQDYAHIMIGCLRSLGIPAGYVSGFLRTIPPEGQPRLAGADAMHAWVRGWCGVDAGWFEYDPTNAADVALDHIVVGYGRDYADVAPVKGVARHAGSHKGRHSVDVIPEESN